MAGPDAPAPGPSACFPRHRRRRLWLLPAIAWAALAWWHTHKPLADGVHVEGPYVPAPSSEVRLLADLSARDADGAIIREQSIHRETVELVRNARGFLVLDYFLFNGQGGPRGPLAPGDGLSPVSSGLIAALRELKLARPALPVLLITDPINDYYRGSAPPSLAALESLGIDVVVTRLDGLRDSNPAYSAAWRLLFRWWAPAAGDGRMPNLLDGAGPRVPLGALLRLPNFKANHRKVAITSNEQGSLVGIVSSANPHDASSAHSNVAMRVTGEGLRSLLQSELAVARFSGWRGTLAAPDASFTAALERDDPGPPLVRSPPGTDGDAVDRDASAALSVRVATLTEGAIHEALIERLAATQRGDAIDIAQFYLSERSIIRQLTAAARRGVTVRVVLDPNRDAFGFEKSGVPNRPVGHELAQHGVMLRWYRTHGEQFHAKLAAVRSGDRVWMTLGSANFTRRNVRDYNLEANVAVDAPADSSAAMQVRDWFEALWLNAGGREYTTSAETWSEGSRLRYWHYRVMEATGLSTF